MAALDQIAATDRLLKRGAIVVPRTSDVLAHHVRQTILSGELQPGQPLPPERDLAAETLLSRGSVREALQQLQLEGLIETRRGRNGGSVRRPEIRQATIAAHDRVAQAIDRRDAQAATRLMAAHVEAASRTAREVAG